MIDLTWLVEVSRRLDDHIHDNEIFEGIGSLEWVRESVVKGDVISV